MKCDVNESRPHSAVIIPLAHCQAGDTYVIQYEGEFVNGVRSGYGIRHYFNGEVYKGQWDSDMRHGQGRMEYLNGDIYDGEWLEDRREGTATFLHGNGDVFVGTFLDDRKEGLGTLYLVSLEPPCRC